MYEGDPTGGGRWVGEGQQGQQIYLQEKFPCLQKSTEGSHYTPVSIIMFFLLLLNLHLIEEVHGFPNWDSLFTQNTLFHQLFIDINNMYGEGGEISALVT